MSVRLKALTRHHELLVGNRWIMGKVMHDLFFFFYCDFAANLKYFSIVNYHQRSLSGRTLWYKSWIYPNCLLHTNSLLHSWNKSQQLHSVQDAEYSASNPNIKETP